MPGSSDESVSGSSASRSGDTVLSVLESAVSTLTLECPPELNAGSRPETESESVTTVGENLRSSTESEDSAPGLESLVAGVGSETGSGNCTSDSGRSSSESEGSTSDSAWPSDPIPVPSRSTSQTTSLPE
jgi:hypothetical protein